MDYIARGKVSAELVHRSMQNIQDAMRGSSVDPSISEPYVARINNFLEELHKEFHKGNFFEAGGISSAIYHEAMWFYSREWGDDVTFNAIHAELEAIQSKIKISLRS